jgi:hypothetical protein
VPLIRAFCASPDIVRLLLMEQCDFPMLLIDLIDERFDLTTDEALTGACDSLIVDYTVGTPAYWQSLHSILSCSGAFT